MTVVLKVLEAFGATLGAFWLVVTACLIVAVVRDRHKARRANARHDAECERIARLVREALAAQVDDIEDAYYRAEFEAIWQADSRRNHPSTGPDQ